MERRTGVAFCCRRAVCSGVASVPGWEWTERQSTSGQQTEAAGGYASGSNIKDRNQQEGGRAKRVQRWVLALPRAERLAGWEGGRLGGPLQRDED